MVLLNQPRGDDPNHTGVPVAACQNQARSYPQVIGQLPKCRFSGGRNLPFRSPPLAIGPTQLNRNLLCPPLVVGQKQLNPSIGPVQPPRSIDPRSQSEGKIPLIELRRLAFRSRNQRPHPRPPHAPHLLQPAPDQRPVLPHQRHDIGNGRESHQIEIAVPKGVRGRVPGDSARKRARGPCPRRPTQPTSKLPRNPGPTKLGKRIPIESRMQNRAIRQLIPRLMVVGDDDLHPKLLRQPHLLHRRDPAIDGDDQPGVPLRKPLDVGGLEPVAIRQAVGDQPVALGAQLAQRPDQERRRADPVDVEIAVDRNPLAGSDPTMPPNVLNADTSSTTAPIDPNAPGSCDSSAARKARAASGVR